MGTWKEARSLALDARVTVDKLLFILHSLDERESRLKDEEAAAFEMLKENTEQLQHLLNELEDIVAETSFTE